MKNKLFLISGPSGAGEDSIIKGLKEKMSIEVVVTTTTREMRKGEAQGSPYYFISKEDFEKNIELGNFYEWTEEDNSNLYGVTKEEIERVKKTDKIGIWKVDYNGVVNIKKILPEVKAIFIDAPEKSLRQRLKARDNADEEFINRRIEYSKGWYKIKHLYDLEVLNEDGKLKESVEKVANFIENIK